MSVRKRTRAVDDDYSSVDVESASSSLRSNHKRPRTVLAAEHGGSTFSDEDDDLGSDHDQAGSRDATLSRFGSVTPSIIPYDSDDENTEEDEIIGTRYMRKQLKTLKENVAQPNGIIEEVLCKNFMCHARLRIGLGPLINFICGHNGSGKSAILAALTICLGSKASSTNRGTSIKDTIKEGEDAAVLSVKIKNQGQGAYRPELYGKSIVVERYIPRTSAPSFKLKSAEGKIVSTKKRDLDDILDFYSLQLDNPINVLNQDMARQFLSNSTPLDKYKFFIKGTLLESLDNDYRIIEETLDSINAKLFSKRDDIALLTTASDEAKRRRALLMENDSVRIKVHELRRMHAWAQVEEQERILADFIEDVARAEERVREAETAAEDASGVYEGRDQAFEQAKRFMTDLEQELDPLTSEFASRKEEFESGRYQLTELQTNMRNAKADYKSAQQKMRSLESDIETEKQILAEAEGSGHVDRLERLASLEADHERIRGDRIDHEKSLTALETRRHEADQALDSFRRTVEERKTDVEQATATLERLESAQDRRFMGYPQGMPRLVQAIEAETRWRRKPAGPIGLCIKLKQPQWASLVETILGGTLNAFVVTCREDQILLRNISERIRYQATAYIVTPERLNAAGKEPSADVDTILRVLDIDDDLVRNVLIIQSTIEQSVLIADRQTAHDFAYASNRPQCVKAVITYDDKKEKSVRFTFSRSGLPSSGNMPLWRGASRLQVNREDQIERQREVVHGAQNAYDSALQELRRLQQAKTTAEQDITRYKRRRHEMISGEQTLHDDIDALKEEIDQNRPKDGRLQELQRQLQEASEEENGHKAIVEDLARAKGTLDGTQIDTKRFMDEAHVKVEQHNRRLADAKEKCEDAEDRRIRSLRAKNQTIEHIRDCQAEVESHMTTRDEQERLVNETFIVEAARVCDRIPVEPGATGHSLDARLERFQHDLERCEREAGGNMEQLTVAYVEAKKKLDDANAQYTELQRFSKTAQRSLATRTIRWKLFRRYISMRARIMFKYLLSERQFRGDVLIDHVNKKLDISVEPDLTRTSDTGREAKTLSGGEKSFSTICLLLSIWEAIASPIRCLDEFDVFMDSVNRATSVDMICQTARRSVGRQFILITPQSMQNVTMGDDVTVYKMPDPERGQQTLPFTQGS